ncbi:MAG: sulfurtransferase [Proteobacteria bacterium]|nr:sulfurtransferase [Pseudomonadota bacterium]
MAETRWVRYTAIAAVLVLGTFWALASAREAGSGYPGGRFLATGTWLRAHLGDPGLVVVDVRTDKDFDGRVIPGAVRLPWSLFRYDAPARSLGGLFVGEFRAQEILGQHGISRGDTVVLYDSVAKDGGAMASYVFWVLDLLGHREMKVLERGIDGWADAGGLVEAAARVPEGVLYQAPVAEIRLDRAATAELIYTRLGDPHYAIFDSRSPEEYRGEKADDDLNGAPLKLGHIPTAYNVDYRSNWVDLQTKALKTYDELRQLYRGLTPTQTLIAYCHSGRRGSFTYFALRLLGFEDVRLYDPSWFEWGNPRLFYPVETKPRELTGAAVSRPVRKASLAPERPGAGTPAGAAPSPAKGGYVSCGG